MLQLMSDVPEDTVGITAKGSISANDYENVLIPAIEEKLESHKKINIIYHIDKEFEKFELGAIWDDAKVGVQHFNCWDKIAIVSDVPWINNMTKAVRMVIPGQIKIYDNEHLFEAKKWVEKH